MFGRPSLNTIERRVMSEARSGALLYLFDDKNVLGLRALRWYSRSGGVAEKGGQTNSVLRKVEKGENVKKGG